MERQSLWSFLSPPQGLHMEPHYGFCLITYKEKKHFITRDGRGGGGETQGAKGEEEKRSGA